jgi:hypothetical protein
MHVSFDVLSRAERWILDKFDRHRTKPIYIYISKSANPPPNIDIIEEHILQSDGSIPTLWLFVAVPKPELSQLNVDLSHNEYLVTAIRSIFLVTLDKTTLDKISKFFIDNKSTINKIKYSFSHAPKYLGSGADGAAFSVGPNLILKIFRDLSAYNSALEAVERLHKNPDLAKTEAMIYDIGVLGEWNAKPLYYYLIELMKPVIALELSVVTMLQNIFYQFGDYYYNNRATIRALQLKLKNPAQHADLKKEVAAIAKSLAEQAAASIDIKHIENNVTGLRSSWLQSLAEEFIMKQITNRTDLHLGNLGITNYGEFRFFDPAYKEKEYS